MDQSRCHRRLDTADNGKARVQLVYSDIAIETALTLCLFFRLPLRQEAGCTSQEREASLACQLLNRMWTLAVLSPMQSAESEVFKKSLHLLLDLCNKAAEPVIPTYQVCGGH